MTLYNRIKTFCTLVLEVGSAVVVGSGLAAALALFVPAVAPAVVPAVAAQTVSPNVPLSQTISHNWSGYVAQNATNNNYTGVGASWVVPTPSTATDNNSQADATWVGIGGVSSNDLIQAGTQAITQNGQIEYQAWVEMLPGYSESLPIAVSGGDSVTVSLMETGTNIWHLVFTDNTTGKTYQTDLTYSSSNSSAEWIEEMPVGVGSGYIPLDQFGSVSFQNGWTIDNDVCQSIADSGAVALKMGLSQDELLATPGDVTADGGGFTVNRSDLALNEVTPTTVQVGLGGGRHRHTRSPTGAAGQGSGIYVVPQGDGSYSVTVVPFSFLRGF